LICSSLPLKAEAQDETAMQLLQRVQNSFVEVRTTATKTFNEANGHTKVATYHAEGFGIIIDSHGLIVTNTHIIANSPQIFVGLSDGTILEAKLVYSSDADFSFIKIDPPQPLEVITWADSSQAKQGAQVIVLNKANDGQDHVLGGEITDLIYGMDSDNVEMFELNIDLVHGDSGGPLLDDQGHLLGMITAKKLSEDNKSYAIASNKIQREYELYEQNHQE